MTSGTATLFLFVTMMSEDAFDFSLTMTGSMALIPSLLQHPWAFLCPRHSNHVTTPPIELNLTGLLCTLSHVTPRVSDTMEA